MNAHGHVLRQCGCLTSDVRGALAGSLDLAVTIVAVRAAKEDVAGGRAELVDELVIARQRPARRQHSASVAGAV